jgi:citrate lyase subunit beta/citryl-CoA lyase
LLFVPGHREGWAAKAVRSGVDAVILDLEDSVPMNLKAEARDMVAESIRDLARNHPDVGVYIRVNAMETGMTGDDLEKVAIPGCHGFVLPKGYGVKDVLALEALTDHFERRNGAPEGSLEFLVSLETAQAYAACEAMIKASPRCATLFAGAARDADVSRSIGFDFTTEGLETLYLRSRAVLATRAAGRDFPIVGIWQDLKDMDGAWHFARQNKQLGFRGMAAIHPMHVAIANEVFTPAAADVAFYQGMIDSFDAAVAKGLAAINYEGMHIDYAHVKTAKEVVALAAVLAERRRSA